MKYITLALFLLSCGSRYQEPVFLTSCQEGPGFLHLGGGCYEVVWPKDRLPLKVSIDVAPGSVLSYGQALRVFERASSRWERRRLGYYQDLFRFTSGEDEDVEVIFNLPSDVNRPHILGEVLFWRQMGGDMRASVHTYNIPTESKMECVMFHELGHVLGLAHDPYGPMRKNACSGEVDEETMYITDLRVTDEDHRRLDRVY